MGQARRCSKPSHLALQASALSFSHDLPGLRNEAPEAANKLVFRSTDLLGEFTGGVLDLAHRGMPEWTTSDRHGRPMRHWGLLHLLGGLRRALVRWACSGLSGLSR